MTIDDAVEYGAQHEYDECDGTACDSMDIGEHCRICNGAGDDDRHMGGGE